MRPLDSALLLIKSFEGCSLIAYEDLRGILTIGYGSTDDVSPGMTITGDQANERLLAKISSISDRLTYLIQIPVTDNQFNALACLAYNIGCGAFAKSTLLEKLNAGDVAGAADEFLRWDKIDGQPCDGLLRRRKAERELFLNGS